MAKKKKVKEPEFTLLEPSTLVPLMFIRPAHSFNESRGGCPDGVIELLGCTRDKEGNLTKIGPKSVTLLDRMIKRWDPVEKIITTDLGLDSKSAEANARVFRKERAADLEHFKTLPVWGKSDKGSYGIDGKTVELTHEDLVAEFERTWPEKIDGKDAFEHPSIEATASGNRRMMILVIRNAIYRKAGMGDQIVTHVEREKRGYATTRARKDDSIYLNEQGKAGKQESTVLQLLRACLELIVKVGANQGRLNDVLAGNRGKVQQFWAIGFVLKVVTWVSKVTYKGTEMTGKKAYETIRASLLSGETPVPAQGARLKRLQQFAKMASHSDGHSDAFIAGVADLKGNKKETFLGLNQFAKFKKHVVGNPSVAQAIVTYFENLSDPNWKDPDVTVKVKSMASADIQSVSTNCSGLVERLLNVTSGVDKAFELAVVAAALESKLKSATLYLPNEDGSMSSIEADQDLLNEITIYHKGKVLTAEQFASLSKAKAKS